MPLRGRASIPRASVAGSLAALALVVGAWVPALAAEPLIPNGLAAAQDAQQQLRAIPEPRVQEPGQAAGFRLPFAAAQQIRIEQGWNSTFSHKGKAAYAYDFGLYKGTDVLAAAAGVVAYTHEGETACGGPELRKNANYVTINHADGSATQYGHLSSVGVKVGDVVAAGQVIGTSGDTGYTQCLPHLHFARQYQGGPVTKSVPVYFQGYAKQEFHVGEYVEAQTSPCPAPSDDAAASSRPAIGTFCGSYFADALDVPASFVRQDGMLSFDWRAKGPGGYWLDDARTGFSARWTGDFAFTTAGTYTVALVWAGSVKVSIDGELVIDRSTEQADPVETVLSQTLGAGIHRIDVEYAAPNGRGVLKLGWGRVVADE